MTGGEGSDDGDGSQAFASEAGMKLAIARDDISVTKTAAAARTTRHSSDDLAPEMERVLMAELQSRCDRVIELEVG